MQLIAHFRLARAPLRPLLRVEAHFLASAAGYGHDSSDQDSQQDKMMPGPLRSMPCTDERLLLDEINHRIINEFTSAIAMLSRAGARSAADEVKTAMNGAAQLLHNYAAVHRALQPPGEETLVNADFAARSAARGLTS
jgi:two-component sensor histidine kinase